LNIGIITSSYPSGPEDALQAPFTKGLIDCLTAAGHNVFILTHQTVDSPKNVFTATQVMWFPWRRTSGRLADLSFNSISALLSSASLFFCGAKACKKLHQEQSIDLFLCLWAVPAGGYMTLARYLWHLKVPFMVWCLGSDIHKFKSFFATRWLLRLILRSSVANFADGIELGKDVASISSKPCGYLSTMRDFGTYQNDLSKPTPYTFLYIGRHSKVKGTDTLIEAFIQLCKDERLNDLKLVLTGSGPLTPELKDLVSKNNLEHRVSFKGIVSDSELIECYRHCHCMVIPSRNESLPLVFGEALQAGLAMIVSDVGDMGHLGTTYHVATVIAPDSPDLLTQAMKNTYLNPMPVPEKNRHQLLERLSFKNSMQKLLIDIENLT